MTLPCSKSKSALPLNGIKLIEATIFVGDTFYWTNNTVGIESDKISYAAHSSSDLIKNALHLKTWLFLSYFLDHHSYSTTSKLPIKLIVFKGALGTDIYRRKSMTNVSSLSLLVTTCFCLLSLWKGYIRVLHSIYKLMFQELC